MKGVPGRNVSTVFLAASRMGRAFGHLLCCMALFGAFAGGWSCRATPASQEEKPRSLLENNTGDGGTLPASKARQPTSGPSQQASVSDGGIVSERRPEGEFKEEPTPDWIQDRPIKFGPERIRLMLEYLRIHYNPKATHIRMQPQMVVIHWTESPSLRGSWNIFNPIRLTRSRPYIRKYGLVNVSVQFLVGRKGEVYRMMPETWMARHAIGLNHLSIGIENAGSARYPLTPKQLEANVRIVRYLCRKYPIRYLIGHHEYLRFRGSSLFIERVKGYRTYKADPGPTCMKVLRQRLADLKLHATPPVQKNPRD